MSNVVGWSSSYATPRCRLTATSDADTPRGTQRDDHAGIHRLARPQKMAEHEQAKLIPPDEVIAQELETKLATDLREIVTERILREAGLDRQVAEALDRIARPTGATMARGIRRRSRARRKASGATTSRRWSRSFCGATQRLLRRTQWGLGRRLAGPTSL